MNAAYVGWFALWLASIIVHLGWMFIACYVVGHLFTEDWMGWRVQVVVWVLWIGVMFVFRGCPLMYVHQYFEVKMHWRERISYQYEESLAYRIVLRHFGED